MGMPHEDGRPTGLLWSDYRSSQRPDSVVIQHPKTNEAVALPLYAADGRPLFPELMQRLDDATRHSKLVCIRDKSNAKGTCRPWPTADQNGMAPFIRRVAKIRNAAGLPQTLTSFRTGGFTARGDADLSDADLNAIGAKTDATRQSTMEQRRRALTRLLDLRGQKMNECPEFEIATRTNVHSSGQI